MAAPEKNLLIHPGGLGDICLSESVFSSLRRHFGPTLQAVGRKSVLDLFKRYFTATHSIDGREWGYLFSGPGATSRWESITLIGKDRSGSFRERLRALARDVIFIDMYPDGDGVHAEAHQLEQLPGYAIRPSPVNFERRPGDRVILYPEGAYVKRKWPVEGFLAVYERLKAQKVNVVLMAPPQQGLPVAGARCYQDLGDVGLFLAQRGGLFFSNDSGMAHLAAHYGLRALTLFHETDPHVWHPRGARYLRCDEHHPTVEEVVALIGEEIANL